MAEVFEQINGCSRPVLVCDFCDRPLRDQTVALVVHGDGDGESVTPSYVCHKFGPCQRWAREAAGHRHGFGATDSVAAHLVALALSVGVSPDDFSRAYDDLGEGGFIPAPSEEE